MAFENYETDIFYDELFERNGEPRASAAPLIKRLKSMSPADLIRQQKAAETEFHQLGITFTVYGDKAGTEKIFPFDIIPRIVNYEEWTHIEAGLTQRIRALNLFIDDIYHGQKILKDNIIPAEMLRTSSGFKPECIGLNPPGGIWIPHHRNRPGAQPRWVDYYVLEDNLRCPSGVSYVLENRSVLKRTLPQGFRGYVGSARGRLSPSPSLTPSAKTAPASAKGEA